ncbi:MAG: cupin domain-containing protein [Solirubrobacteraceae bacterium]
MAVAPPQYVVNRSQTIEYQPMFIDREQVGEAHMLRTEGSHGNAHEACLWRTDAPARYEYFFSGDESFYVLEGSVSIELAETGERIELKEGDVASFPKGTRSVWTFSEPFKKFTVISN